MLASLGLEGAGTVLFGFRITGRWETGLMNHQSPALFSQTMLFQQLRIRWCLRDPGGWNVRRCKDKVLAEKGAVP
jgi:hypothetical protein